MATDPARDGLAAALAPVVDTSEDVPRFRDAIWPFVESEIAAARRQAFTEAAAAIRSLMDRQPLFDERDTWAQDVYGEAFRAVRGLGEETASVDSKINKA